MKFKLAVLALALPALLMATPAAADDALGAYSIQNVVTREDFNSQTQGIRFYFGDAPHPRATRTIQSNITTSVRGRKSGRAAEEACQWTMMSALYRLRDAALRNGGNAVVNIRSNWQNVETSSRTEYQCSVGGLMAGVALKADIVSLP